MNAPTINTSRLVLRPVRTDDLDALAVIQADDAVGRTIGGARSRQDVWFSIMRSVGFWQFLRYGFWTVCERETDEIVGEVGFADFQRGLEPDISGTPEAGWIIAPSHWGKGYATEAVEAAHIWLDDSLPGRSTCIINQDNIASKKVAKRFGYQQFASAQLREDTVLVFERNTPETRKA